MAHTENSLPTNEEGEVVAAFDTVDVAHDLGPPQDALEGVPAPLAIMIGQRLGVMKSLVPAAVSCVVLIRRDIQKGSPDMIASNRVSSTKPRHNQRIAQRGVRLWCCIIEAQRWRKLRAPLIELVIQLSGEVWIRIITA